MELIKEVKYLDKGYIQYYDLSESTKNLTEAKKTIANIATLSYGNDFAKDYEKLFNYLDKHNHLSVFEFIRCPYRDSKTNKIVNYKIENSFRFNRSLIYDPDTYKISMATYKIKAPIFVFRQLFRHRCFSILELSRRYVTNKKISLEFYIPEYLDDSIKDKINSISKIAEEYYEDLLNNSKVKAEVARIILPLNLYSIAYIQGDFECLQNFFRLRMDIHAQYEIRELATIMYNLLPDNHLARNI